MLDEGTWADALVANNAKASKAAAGGTGPEPVSVGEGFDSETGGLTEGALLMTED